MSQLDAGSGHPAPPRRLRLVGIVFVIAIIIIVAYGLVSRAAQNSHLTSLTDEEAIPDRRGRRTSEAENHEGLELPGRLEAYIRAPIYARVPGYLKSWKYDIAPSEGGQRAGRNRHPRFGSAAQSGTGPISMSRRPMRDLAKISATRWQSLAGTDAVAKQDVDQRTYSLNANLAQVKAAQANVDRLTAEQGFKRLIAPFDGVVTARDTDIGALINVGGSGGVELFVVSATNKRRVYINVPQNYVAERDLGYRGDTDRAGTSGEDIQRDGGVFRAIGQSEHRNDADADHRR